MKNSSILNMRIPTQLYEDLKKAAEQKNISMASVVRIACTEYLEREKAK